MSLRTTLQPRWDALAPRERIALIGAGLLVACALLWWILLSPALQTLRAAESQHRQLDAQLQAMRGLQAEALALQGQPKMSYDDALRALETSVRQRLGATGQLSVAGERATVTLKGAQADALARWLTQARVNARALPTEARLVRSTASPASTAAAGYAATLAVPSTAPQTATSAATWDGTLVLTLPSR